MQNTPTVNKTVAVSYILIGAAVVTSVIYTKMLERDAVRFSKKMRADRQKLIADVDNVYHIHSIRDK